MLHRVLERFDTDEVHGALDLNRVAGHADGGDVRGQRHPVRQRTQRHVEPTVGQDRRVHAPGECSQLFQCLVDLGSERPDLRDAGDRVAVHHRFGDRQLDAQRDEPLLGTVMEVVFDPRALDVGRLGDATARTLQVGHRVAQVERGGVRGARRSGPCC